MQKYIRSKNPRSISPITFSSRSSTPSIQPTTVVLARPATWRIPPLPHNNLQPFAHSNHQQMRESGHSSSFTRITLSKLFFYFALMLMVFFSSIHILEAVRIGLVPRVTRRLTGQERSMIRPGTVWVWEEGELVRVVRRADQSLPSGASLTILSQRRRI